jgi:AcrR family transcriptional regulator
MIGSAGPASGPLSHYIGCVARTPDLELKLELLDSVVSYLASHGLAAVSLRPLAEALGTSASRLVHHLGPKDQILAAALQRANEVQEAIGTEWLRRSPNLTVSQWFRKWWRWINESPSNLAVTRLGYEAVTLDATVTGPSAQFRADQISLWMRYPEEILVRSGMPRPEAKREAVLAKAVFTGLVLDLLASGDRQRLTRALEDSLERLEERSAQHSALAAEPVLTDSDLADAAPEILFAPESDPSDC